MKMLTSLLMLLSSGMTGTFFSAAMITEGTKVLLIALGGLGLIALLLSVVLAIEVFPKRKKNSLIPPATDTENY